MLFIYILRMSTSPFIYLNPTNPRRNRINKRHKTNRIKRIMVLFTIKGYMVKLQINLIRVLLFMLEVTN